MGTTGLVRDLSSVQSTDQLTANFELNRGIREVVANRLTTAAEMHRQERFRHGRK